MKLNCPETLVTERLDLRPIKPEDASAFFAIFSDEETVRYWSDVPIKSMQQAEKLIEREFELQQRDDCHSWAIERRDTSECIGKFTLFNYSEQNLRAELGYILHRQHWGSGYMSEVMATVIELAFTDFKLHRIEADTDPQNLASLALLNKFGFEREGLFKDRWLIDGRWHDSVMLGLIRKSA